MKIRLSRSLAVLAALATIGGGVIAFSPAIASAETTSSSTPSSFLSKIKHVFQGKGYERGREGMMKGPAITGTVSGINGNSITLAGKNGTTYTVNVTSSTKITKFTTASSSPATIAVSGIQVGDTLMVKGTLSGTTVTATSIFDGVAKGMRGPPERENRGVIGTITAVNGTTLTVTGPNGQTFTLNAIGAEVFVPMATSTNSQ